jgi:hypothetical protein
MKVLIAIDTSGIYSHDTTVQNLLDTLKEVCHTDEVDFVTFDKRGIVKHDILSFINAEESHFMEEPAYKELFELMEEYDTQKLITSYSSVDVLELELQEYSLQTYGFEQ